MPLHTFPVGPLGANCYLLTAGGGAVLVDPGGDAGALCRAMEELAVTPAAILLTHGHFDHVEGVAGLRAAFPGLPIYIHPADVSPRPGQFTWTGLPGWLPLSDDQKLTFGEIQLSVIHTPGHSPGSVTFRWGDRLFTGDTLFQGSMGRVDFPGGDSRAMSASLRRLAALPGGLAVYPGHGPATTLEAERRTNPFLREAMA